MCLLSNCWLFPWRWWTLLHSNVPPTLATFSIYANTLTHNWIWKKWHAFVLRKRRERGRKRAVENAMQWSTPWNESICLSAVQFRRSIPEWLPPLLFSLCSKDKDMQIASLKSILAVPIEFRLPSRHAHKCRLQARNLCQYNQIFFRRKHEAGHLIGQHIFGRV